MGKKFTITKGVDNVYTFTIKEHGVTTPMMINPTDTFIASLIDLDSEMVVLTKPMDVESVDGRVSLTIGETETNSLVGDRGKEVDRYYLKPVYKIILECSTEVNGDFIAKVMEVYVDG